MKISELLAPRNLRVLHGCSSRENLFHALAELAHGNLPQDTSVTASQLAHALSEREGLGSTAVGHGVALPHTRVFGLASSFGVFIKLDHPIEFEAPDTIPVDLVFSLFAPLNSDAQHLRSLARVARTMRQRYLCDRLRMNNDPASLYGLLIEEENLGT